MFEACFCAGGSDGQVCEVALCIGMAKVHCSIVASARASPATYVSANSLAAWPVKQLSTTVVPISADHAEGVSFDILFDLSSCIGVADDLFLGPIFCAGVAGDLFLDQFGPYL